MRLFSFRFWSFVLCALVIGAQPGIAQEEPLPTDEKQAAVTVFNTPVTIVGTLIPGVLDDAEPGPYNEIYRIITEGFPGEIEFSLVPIRRAQRSFYNRQAMCTFVGSNAVQFLTARGIDINDVIFSTAIKHINVRVYTMPSVPIVNSSDQLAGKVVALDIAAGGLDVFKEMFLPDDSIVISTNSVEQAFALLAQGRVDAVIAFDFDVDMLKKQLPGISEVVHAPGYAIAANDDLLSCWRTPETEALIEYVNIKLAGIREDGRLQALIEE